MFTWSIRMCFQDVDAEGIVYHANYLKYAERARTDWIYTLGLSNAGIMAEGVALVLRHIEVDYMAPAQLDDILTLNVRILEVRNASMIIEQIASVDGKPKCKMVMQIAAVNKETLRPTRLSVDAKEKFINYMNTQGE